MNLEKVNLTTNHPLFNLIFNLGDQSQLKDLYEHLQQKSSSDWKIEIYDHYYLLIGDNPIILLKTIKDLSIDFNIDIKLLTTNYAEIPSQISGIQSQIFPKVTLDNDYQLSCLGSKISIRCAPLPSKTLSIIEKLPFEKTPEPLGVRYKQFTGLHFDLARLKREAESLNLSTSGTKEKLISRLHQKLQPDMRYSQEN